MPRHRLIEAINLVMVLHNLLIKEGGVLKDLHAVQPLQKIIIIIIIVIIIKPINW